MSEKSEKTVSFYSVIDQSTENIAVKIQQYCAGLEAQGYLTHIVLIRERGFLKRVRALGKIKVDESDVLLIRNSIYTPFVFINLLIARFRGQKIVIEMPTPLRIMVSEIIESERTLPAKYSLILFLYLCFPLALWPSHRVLHYSIESWYFLLGVRKKYRFITNGIDTGCIKLREREVESNPNSIVFIAVAMFQPSHGYERIIWSIHQYINDYTIKERRKVKLILVGEGALQREWKVLVEKLSLKDYVEFTGIKTGIELDALFEQADIAVGKLAPYKINLQIASELKLRGYCARGIPFIKSCKDPDFPDELEFVYNVENSSKLIDIQDLLKWYDNLNQSKLTERIRRYAEEHLDYKKKELLYL